MSTVGICAGLMVGTFVGIGLVLRVAEHAVS